MSIELTLRSGVAVVTLARPPVNAIDDTMIAALHSVLDSLDRRDDWQVLHLRSAQKVFAAGADLALIRSWKDAASPQAALAGYIDRLQGLYRRIENLAAVSICELSGAAMGGGFELALSCDLRVAADEAKLALPEVGIGLLPGAGGTQRLTRLCGRGIASRMILSGEPVDGKTALALGMVEWAFPRAELADQARGIVDRLAALPVHAQSAAKRCIAAAGTCDTAGFELERTLGGALLESSRTQALISEFLVRNARPRA